MSMFVRVCGSVCMSMCVCGGGGHLWHVMVLVVVMKEVAQTSSRQK
jgi:hypothetical protein